MRKLSPQRNFPSYVKRIFFPTNCEERPLMNRGTKQKHSKILGGQALSFMARPYKVCNSSYFCGRGDCFFPKMKNRQKIQTPALSRLSPTLLFPEKRFFFVLQPSLENTNLAFFRLSTTTAISRFFHRAAISRFFHWAAVSRFLHWAAISRFLVPEVICRI